MIYGELENWSVDGYNQFEHDGSTEFDVTDYCENNKFNDEPEDEEIPF